MDNDSDDRIEVNQGRSFFLFQIAWLLCAFMAVYFLWLQSSEVAGLEQRVNQIESWALGAWEIEQVAEIDSVDVKIGSQSLDSVLIFVVTEVVSGQSLGRIEARVGADPLKLDPSTMRGVATIDDRDGANVTTATFSFPVRAGEFWTVETKWSQKPSAPLTGKVYMLRPQPVGSDEREGLN